MQAAWCSRLFVERLEERVTPGADLLTIPLWMGSVLSLQARAKTVPIEVPQADLVLIAATKDGKHTPYLNYAHDVNWAPNKPHDVNNIDAVVAEIQSRAGQLGRAIDVTLVGSTTQGDSGVIVGTSYLFAHSADTQKLIAGAGVQVRNLSFLVSYGSKKVELYQTLANGLAHNNFVTVSGYSGYVGVVDGNPGHFVVAAGSTILTAQN